VAHDTTQDPRILVAHLACSVLKKCVKQKPKVSLPVGRGRLSELAAACDSAAMTLLYLYQDPPSLAEAEPTANLLAGASALAEAYAPLVANRDDASLLRAEVRWCLRTLNGFARRLRNAGSTLASGVDLAAVQVRRVVRSGGFWETAVTDGREEYVVVTNIGGIGGGAVLAAAFLTPQEVGGTVSEAMFLGGEVRAEAPGTLLGEDAVDAREAAGVLYEALARYRSRG
jgi:predicted RNA-binding protein with EMAP domain